MPEQENLSSDVFRDSSDDLEAMRRYELFLQLQDEADGLTDEQYIARLDEIAGSHVPEVLSGAYAYGDMDLSGDDAAKMFLLEREPQDDIHAAADAVQYGTSSEPGQDGYAVPGGTNGQEDPGLGERTTYGKNGEEAFDPGAGAIDTDGIQTGDGEATPGLNDERVENAEEADMEGVPLEDTAARDAGPAVALDGLEEEAMNGMDVQSGAHGLEQEGQSIHTVPPGDMDDEAEPPEPGIPQQGHFEEHSEFEVHDFLDDMAVGSGLAGAVVSYEYIPPEPEAETEEDGPAMKSMKACIREMDGVDGPGRDIEGPSV